MSMLALVHVGHGCPSACLCVGVTNIVNCDGKGYEHIPAGIPSSTTQLALSENHFITGTIQKRNFSSLLELQKLYLSRCGIETIEPGTFEDLVDLTFLDLGKNRLKFLGPYVFRGLNLQHLFLQQNPHVRLSIDVFKGMTTQGLHLSECYFHRIDHRVFEPLEDSLKILWLDKNRLKSLSKDLVPILSKLRHLRLGGNPLHCNCELQWLKTFFDNTPGMFSTVIPSCITPPALAGKTFSAIDIEQMACSVPVLQDMEVLLDEWNVTLRCAAQADPAPTLYWQTPDGDAFSTSAKHGSSVTQAELLLSRSARRGVYSCMASNPAGNSTLALAMRWPTRPVILPRAPMTSRTPIPPSTSPCEPEPPVPQVVPAGCEEEQRFTLLELLGAAAGSFCLAVVVSILCLLWTYKRLTAQRPHKNRRYESTTLSSAKENLYSTVSQEERERFSLEEKERLYATSNIREFCATTPSASSFRRSPYDTQSSLTPDRREYPVYGHSHLVRVAQPIVPHGVPQPMVPYSATQPMIANGVNS